MNAFNNFLAEDRRLAMLRLLKECGGSANDGILHSGLEQYGHRRNPRSTILEDMRFLVTNGLATEEWFNQVMVVNITTRGVDAAEGRVFVEGVKRPSIGV